MREKLNSNPIYQAAALGVLGILIAFFLLTRMGGGGGEVPVEDVGGAPGSVGEETAPLPSSPATPVPGATTDPAAPATPAPTTPAPEAVPSPGGGAAKGSFKESPGLPGSIVSAYEANKQIVLLITDSGGIDDKRVARAVGKLRTRPDVSITVIGADKVTDYSRITRGVNLNRTPAMIVVEPKSRAGAGLPEATVSYGYRGFGSVRQAVSDIVYNGPDVGFDPN